MNNIETYLHGICLRMIEYVKESTEIFSYYIKRLGIEVAMNNFPCWGKKEKTWKPKRVTFLGFKVK